MSEASALLDKTSIQQLPPFENLNHQNIVVIENGEQCKTIEEELKAATFLGFDSESKPTFQVGRSINWPTFDSAGYRTQSLFISCQFIDFKIFTAHFV